MISNLRFGLRSKMPLVVAVAALLGPAVAHAQPAAAPAAHAAFATASPEAAGMSAARLTRLTNAFKKRSTTRRCPARS